MRAGPLERTALSAGQPAGARDPLPLLAASGAVLTFVVIVAAAALRLLQIGLGCEPWPECYGSPAAEPHSALVVAMRAAHRLAAMAVAVLAVLAAGYAWRERSLAPGRMRAAGALVALTFLLAAFGIASGASVSVPVAVTNVAAGTAMLALFTWIAIADPAHRGRPRVRAYAVGTLLAGVIALGVATSAKLAGRACPELFACDALPGSEDFAAALGNARLQLAHRLVALCAAAALAFLAWTAWRRGGRTRMAGTVLAVAVAVQMALGAALVLLDLPLLAAAAHSATAALIVAAAVACASRGRE